VRLDALFLSAICICAGLPTHTFAQYMVESEAAAADALVDAGFWSNPMPGGSSAHSASAVGDARASGFSGRGFADAAALASGSGTAMEPISFHAKSDVISTIVAHDLLFSSAATTPISVRFHLVLAGSFSAAGIYRGNVEVFSVLSQEGNSETAMVSGTATESSGAAPETHGDLTGYALGTSRSFLSPSIMLTTNTPCNFSLRLTIDSFAGDGHSIGGSSRLDPYRLSFPTEGFCFDVPDGISVNSPTLGVVENHLFIPEPGSSLALSLTLLIRLAAARRNRAPRESPNWGTHP
jgi:hypothetical protein